MAFGDGWADREWDLGLDNDDLKHWLTTLDTAEKEKILKNLRDETASQEKRNEALRKALAIGEAVLKFGGKVADIAL